MKKLRWLAPFAAIASLLLSTVPTAMAADAMGEPIDNVIISGARLLSADEVRGADVTETSKGERILQDAADGPDGLDIGQRPYRAFVFGHQKMVIDASSRLNVVTGLNSDGEQVFELAPQARPGALSARAGYVVPPTSAWVFNNDGGYTHIDQICDWLGNNCKDARKRIVHWTIMYAGPSGSYAYWRMYGRMQAQTFSPATYYPYDARWQQAVLLFDANNWGGSPNDNFGDEAQPDQDYAGPGNQEVSIGFNSGLDFQLGAPPLRAGGDFDSSYLGKITLSTEWWHPWVVNEIGSGGVQYCNYSGNGNYNKKVTARVSIRHYKTGAVGSWGLGDYQLSNTFNCPGQH